jgi:hypothetical protein
MYHVSILQLNSITGESKLINEARLEKENHATSTLNHR